MPESSVEHNISSSVGSDQGLRLRHIRNMFMPELSQSDLAEIIDIGNNHISRVELGKKLIGSQMLKRLTRLKGLNLEYIVEGKGEPFPKGLPEIVRDSEGKVTEVRLSNSNGESIQHDKLHPETAIVESGEDELLDIRSRILNVDDLELYRMFHRIIRIREKFSRLHKIIEEELDIRNKQ